MCIAVTLLRWASVVVCSDVYVCFALGWLLIGLCVTCFAFGINVGVFRVLLVIASLIACTLGLCFGFDGCLNLLVN